MVDIAFVSIVADQIRTEINPNYDRLPGQSFGNHWAAENIATAIDEGARAEIFHNA